jgi:WhiB family redox-sensing transcriptional regulator
MVAARRHWRSAAACRFADPELFFPVSSSGLALEQEAEAKAICARCQVRPECLAFALRTRQVHGVWGGMSEQERCLLWSRDERRIDSGAGDRNTRRLRPDDNPAPDRRARQR